MDLPALTGPQTNTLLTPHHDVVAHLITQRLEHAHAPGTKSTYSSAWNAYQATCVRLGSTPDPVTEDKILAFIAVSHQEGRLLGTTLKGYVSALTT